MATILVNGCFDLLHEGHITFLLRAKHTVCQPPNCLVVAVNSDESARQLKAAKWGEKYPIDSLATRSEKLSAYADQVIPFDCEDRLREIIEFLVPCILVKGPDYAGKRVTGDDIAPVVILDTPEPESVKLMKREIYGIAAKR
jgi:D-beta-D-heptose 7-phosphate kinase/D-beta-D-heptose 1-phosphate adenosyltransferase